MTILLIIRTPQNFICSLHCTRSTYSSCPSRSKQTDGMYSSRCHRILDPRREETRDCLHIYVLEIRIVIWNMLRNMDSWGINQLSVWGIRFRIQCFRNFMPLSNIYSASSFAAHHCRIFHLTASVYYLSGLASHLRFTVLPYHQNLLVIVNAATTRKNYIIKIIFIDAEWVCYQQQPVRLTQNLITP